MGPRTRALDADIAEETYTHLRSLREIFGDFPYGELEIVQELLRVWLFLGPYGNIASAPVERPKETLASVLFHPLSCTEHGDI